MIFGPQMGLFGSMPFHRAQKTLAFQGSTPSHYHSHSPSRFLTVNDAPVGLHESHVDSDEEDLAESIKSFTLRDTVRDCLEKDPADRTEEDIEVSYG